MSDQPTIRYSDTELAEFKSLIDQKLVKARQEMDYLSNQIVEMQDNTGGQKGGDISDGSSRHTEIEMLSDMASRQRQFIRNLENALLRIRNKTYGVCSVTGELIDKKRLLLVPHATKSIAGKQGGSRNTSSSSRKDSTKSAAVPKIISKVISRPSKKSSNTPPPDENWEEQGMLDKFDDDIMELELDQIPQEDLDDQD